MRKFEIYKYLGETIPDSVEGIFVWPKPFSFFKYSGAILIDDNKCNFDGPDTQLGEKLKKALHNNALQKSIAGYDEEQKLLWDGFENIVVSEKSDFIEALEEFLSKYGCSIKTPLLDLIKVNNIEDIKEIKAQQNEWIQHRKTA